MDASPMQALFVFLIILGGFAYAGFLIFLGVKLKELELRLDALEEAMEEDDELR